MQYIILFKNIREVIKAEKICGETGVKTTIIPVPSNLSSECGMALLSDDNNIEAVKSSLSKINLTPTIHERK